MTLPRTGTDTIPMSTLCRCGHHNGGHIGPDGLGPCDISVRPGELCDCEAFEAVPPPAEPSGNPGQLDKAQTNGPKETDMHPDLIALKKEVDKLYALLSDPQPGLMTWNGFVKERWNAIIELAKSGAPKE